MRARIWKDFRFEAAHFLPNLPEAHKCRRPHGHSYLFRLEIEGPIDPALGWVADFGGHLKAAGDMLCGILDHRSLNEIEGLANPTAENLAVWISLRLTAVGLPHGVRWSGVEVMETESAGVRLDFE